MNEVDKLLDKLEACLYNLRKLNKQLDRPKNDGNEYEGV